MPLNNGRPIIGRFRKLGLGFLSSSWGLPVPGSIGSLSPTITPQMPPPHLLTRTRASPAWVCQTPVGSPAPCARAEGAAKNVAAIAMRRAVLQAMNHSFENRLAWQTNRVSATSDCARLLEGSLEGSLAPAGQANRQG